MKTTKMTGFLCQSPAATAVCKTVDTRSVIVPRRSERSSMDGSRLMDMKYYRLMESKRLALYEQRSMAMATTIRRDRKPTTVTTNPSSLPTSDQVFQVVVMRVSLHCQGCAGKVKKHLSRMEGVTSFSIDLDSKRVTVMGHVSPVGVLASISKVKKAEFWPC